MVGDEERGGGGGGESGIKDLKLLDGWDLWVCRLRVGEGEGGDVPEANLGVWGRAASLPRCEMCA